MGHEKLYRRFCEQGNAPAGNPAESSFDVEVQTKGDPSGDGGPAASDAGRLTPARLEELRNQLASEPSFTLDVARRSLDASLTPQELHDLLAQAAASFEDEDAAVQFVDLSIALGLGKISLPDNFSFPGIDPKVEIIPRDVQFETRRDALGWVFNTAGYWLRAQVHQPKYPFRWAEAAPSRFSYPMKEDNGKTRIALFSDFGTGLYHSRYIARQIAQTEPHPHLAIHLGDVYYAGTQREFDNRFIDPLQVLVASCEFWAMNGNHEMFSDGRPYFGYLLSKWANGHRQEGSYFCLASKAFQLVAIDTDYHSVGRFNEPRLLEWLAGRLKEGREAGCINILLSGDEPYTIGAAGKTALLREDLSSFAGAGLVDLWFWGNTHYCAVFERGATTPFVGSCIGHGGYPYDRLKESDAEGSLAKVRWHETEARFPGWTEVRQDRGNNGYVLMDLDHDNGIVELAYMDWMQNMRRKFTLRRRDGVLDFT